MFEEFSIWAFLAGLGIFLLGMRMIEDALSVLAGRPFKRFLRRNTSHPVKAILSGTIVTILLQSSSIVSLMVLAMVGAGIIELANAIGIILGSNLGTTFTGWIVAFFGFSFDIEKFALPFVAIGGLLMVFFSDRKRLNEAGRFIGGMGFLFLGLEYMKSGIESLGHNFDLSPYISYGPYFLFLIGFLLAALIQSSSAVMVIALSALNASMIPLVSAAAMVIGSDLGTTITVMLGGIKGSPAKKRVALSHFLFNLIVDIIALALLYPLIRFITEIIGFQNPLFSLVAFHTCFNFFGILLFLPFLKRFARLLEKFIKESTPEIALFIKDVPSEVSEIAIHAMEHEVEHLFRLTVNLHLSILAIDKSAFQLATATIPLPEDNAKAIKQYAHIKELEGELVAFFVQIQNKPLISQDSLKLKQIILVIRNTMEAAKGIKDIHHNIQEFHHSINDSILHLFGILQIQQQAFILELVTLGCNKGADPADLGELKITSKSNYNKFLNEAYRAVRLSTLSDLEISTLFNVNREIHQSNKALIQAGLGMHNLSTKALQ